MIPHGYLSNKINPMMRTRKMSHQFNSFCRILNRVGQIITFFTNCNQNECFSWPNDALNSNMKEFFVSDDAIWWGNAKIQNGRQNMQYLENENMKC